MRRYGQFFRVMAAGMLVCGLTVALGGPDVVMAAPPPDVGEPVCVNPPSDPVNHSSTVGCLRTSVSGFPTVTVSGALSSGFTTTVDTGGIRACANTADAGPCFTGVMVAGQSCNSDRRPLGGMSCNYLLDNDPNEADAWRPDR